jgi:hypothetical protein
VGQNLFFSYEDEKTRAGVVAQMMGLLPNMLEALSSISNTILKKKKKGCY